MTSAWQQAQAVLLAAYQFLLDDVNAKHTVNWTFCCANVGTTQFRLQRETLGEANMGNVLAEVILLQNIS